MEKEIYSKFLWRKDDNRPEMSGVIYDGNGFAYATDAKRALRWEEKKAKNAKLDVASIFEGNWTKSIEFNKSDYDQWKGNLPMVDEKIYCDVCGGEGLVEWDFQVWTKMFECPECDGDKFHISGNKVPDDSLIFQFESASIDQKTAKILMSLMKRDGVEEIKLYHSPDSTFLLRGNFSDCSMLFAVPHD